MATGDKQVSTDKKTQTPQTLICRGLAAQYNVQQAGQLIYSSQKMYNFLIKPAVSCITGCITCRNMQEEHNKSKYI